MSTEVKVPQLPESVADATLVEWRKQPGDAVEPGDILADLETDKVVLECPSTVTGVLSEHVVEVGATVVAGDLIARIDEGASASPAAAEEPAAEAAADDDGGSEKGLSPAVRRMVEENGLDASKIKGSGKDGRLTKADVQAFMDSGAKAEAAAPAAAPAPAKAAAPAEPSGPISVPSGDRVEQRVPMTRLRKRIAERLVDAQATAAMLTTFNEIDMKPLMDLRGRYKDQFEKTHDTRLGFMGMFVKAAIEGLKRLPAVNASIDGDDIIYHGFYDIGIAVSSPRGLVVPIVRDADQLSLADVEKTIRGFGKAAQTGSLTMEDLTGGTFSITNGGVFGSMLSTPILNPPQSAILGMHAINDKPVVVDGEIVIRPIMMVALTYDHRIIDGSEAVTFLKTIKECIEDPARLLLQV